MICYCYKLNGTEDIEWLRIDIKMYDLSKTIKRPIAKVYELQHLYHSE